MATAKVLDMDIDYGIHRPVTMDYGTWDVCETCLMCRESAHCDEPCACWQNLGDYETVAIGCDECNACTYCDSGYPECTCCGNGHGFMARPCDACGDKLAGNRYPFIVRVDVPAELVDEFIGGYIDGMLFANVIDVDGSGADTGRIWQAWHVSDGAMRAMVDDAREWLGSYWPTIWQAVTESAGRYSLEAAGQDYALTRNRHGAGYWDRGLGALGVRLTDSAHYAGESWLQPDECGNGPLELA